MGFRNGTYCKVWSKEDKGKYTVVNLSISKKNKETGKYETEFANNFVRFVGTAHDVISQIDIPEKGGVSVKISSCDVTNHYDAEKNTTYTNYVVFGIETNDNSSKTKASKKADVAPATEEDDDDMPF